MMCNLSYICLLNLKTITWIKSQKLQNCIPVLVSLTLSVCHHPPRDKALSAYECVYVCMSVFMSQLLEGKSTSVYWTSSEWWCMNVCLGVWRNAQVLHCCFFFDLDKKKKARHTQTKDTKSTKTVSLSMKVELVIGSWIATSLWNTNPHTHTNSSHITKKKEHIEAQINSTGDRLNTNANEWSLWD